MVSVGHVKIGGGAPISIQSMTTTDTSDADATLAQIRELAEAGCDIVRLAVNDRAAVDALPRIQKESSLPLVADIHYDYRLALEAIRYVDKLRINPGTMRKGLAQIAAGVKEYGIPVRVGANAGSLRRDSSGSGGLISDAIEQVRLLESHGVTDIVVSLKASDVSTMIAAYTDFARVYSYPLHLGVTEAGVGEDAIIRSSVGIGSLLSRGIGDTVRVSLSGSPVKEIEVARKLLETLGLRKGCRIIGCPTCARCTIDVQGISEKATELVTSMPSPERSMRIAVMGCMVNGIGEADTSDIALVGHERGPLLCEGGKQGTRKRLSCDEAPAEFLSRLRCLLEGGESDESDNR